MLTEQDGVLSLVRLVDRIIHSSIGPGAPDEMPPIPVNLTLAVVLKSGAARGRYMVGISVEGPSGQTVGEPVTLPVLLEGEDRGVNLLVQVGLQAEHEGLYWFDVRFGSDGVLLTRVPLRVIYQPQRIGRAPTEAAE